MCYLCSNQPELERASATISSDGAGTPAESAVCNCGGLAGRSRQSIVGCTVLACGSAVATARSRRGWLGTLNTSEHYKLTVGAIHLSLVDRYKLQSKKKSAQSVGLHDFVEAHDRMPKPTPRALTFWASSALGFSWVCFGAQGFRIFHILVHSSGSDSLNVLRGPSASWAVAAAFWGRALEQGLVWVLGNWRLVDASV